MRDFTGCMYLFHLTELGMEIMIISREKDRYSQKEKLFKLCKLPTLSQQIIETTRQANNPGLDFPNKDNMVSPYIIHYI